VWGKLFLITSSPPCQIGVRRCHAVGSVELLVEVKIAVNVLYKSLPISIKAQKTRIKSIVILNNSKFKNKYGCRGRGRVRVKNIHSYIPIPLHPLKVDESTNFGF
jgi:predicted type IV restriction endonuclease